MAHRRHFVFVVVFALVLTVASSFAWAQIVTGTILGTVSDSTGGVMPGVTVTIRNMGTDLTRTVVTDEQGRYREPQLPLGPYDVRAEIQGFRTQVRQNIQLTVGAEIVLNFSLEIGTIEESVTVTTQAPTVQLASAEVGALIDRKMIEELPLNARDIQQLAVLQPGIQSQAAYNGLYGANITVRGSRPEQNRYLLNGVDAGTTFGTSPVSAANIMMGVEGLQEFKVLTSDYSAAYGLKQGGVINMVTKAGTNEFNGSAYEFFRNDRFDARNYFDLGEPAPFNRHQFGASLGGPIVRGKTFFFTNYEQFYHRLGLTHLGFVPDERARQGYLPDPRNPGQEIFVGLVPQMAPYLNLYPLPNGRNLGDGTAEFFSNPEQAIDERYITVRIDQQLGRNNSFWTVFTGDWSESLTPEASNAFAGHSRRDKAIWSVQDSHVFSSHFIGNVRFGLNWNRYLDENDPLVEIERALYLADPFPTPTGHGQFPNIGVGGLSGLASTGNGPVWYDRTAVSLDADFNYVQGAHAWQFGASWSRAADDGSFAAEQLKGETSFEGLRDFLQGRADRVNILLPGSRPQTDFRTQLASVYVEDSIRPSPNFTLSAGLRWEALLRLDEAEGEVANLRGGPMDPTPTVGNPILIGEKDNFAPRVGFNWNVFGDGRTSLRGGAGVFYNQITPYSMREMSNNPPLVTQVSLLSVPFPNVFEGFVPSEVPPDMAAVEFRPETPILYSYHLALQRELRSRTSVTLTYVGSQGRHLPTGTIVNSDHGNRLVPDVLPDGRYFWPPSLTRPNPNFGRIGYGFFNYDSSYNSLQVGVDRRVVEGLGFTANYNWADCVDDVSGEMNSALQNGGGPAVLQYSRDPKSGRGNCSFTSAHSGNITTTWDLPGLDLRGPAGALFGGWRWSTISTIQAGYPFNIATGFNRSRQNLGTRPLGDRPNWAPGCNADNVILGGVDRYFDVNCFELPAPGFLGNVPARILRGPGLFTMDWSLTKSFRVGDGSRVEVTTQAFNITNRANFRVPAASLWRNATTRNINAGRITGTVTPSRQLQFGVKFIF